MASRRVALARLHHRPFRRHVPRLVAVGAALATVLGVAAVGGPAAPAHADVKRDIADAQQRLDALDQHAEKVAEAYNAARIQLATAQRRYLAAQDRVAREDAKVATLRRTIGAFAAAAYRSHGLAELKAVTDSSPQTFLDRANSLDQIARSQQEALASMRAARLSLADAQAAASRALGSQKAATDKIAADRAEIRRSVDAQQALLRQLRAKEAEIERQARLAAARARAAAARAAALRAAREAAARAAAYAAQQAAYNNGLSSLDSQPTTTADAGGGSGGAAVAVQWAYRELGKPYVWGAEGPDAFDCSGLTKYVWAKAGVYLDHYTGAQWGEGRHVSRDELQPGDLVFFGGDLHHVGIYIGNSQMIEAPHTGADVRIAYAFRGDYAGAVRPGG